MHLPGLADSHQQELWNRSAGLLKPNQLKIWMALFFCFSIAVAIFSLTTALWDLWLYTECIFFSYSVSSAEEEKAELQRFSKNFLPILFNVYSQPPIPGETASARMAVLDTIRVYLSITEQAVINYVIARITLLQSLLLRISCSLHIFIVPLPLLPVLNICSIGADGVHISAESIRETQQCRQL